MTLDLKTELDKLAKTLVAESADKDAPLSDKIAAFKELRAYYTLLLKNPADPAEDDEDFDFTRTLGGTNGAVSGRRNT